MPDQEQNAREIARTTPGIGAAAVFLGTAAVTVASGASGTAIMSTLATIRGTVGGGAIAGTLIISLAPVATASAIGYGVYKLLGGKSIQSTCQTQNINSHSIEHQIATVPEENLRQAKIDRGNQERIEFRKSRGIDVK